MDSNTQLAFVLLIVSAAALPLIVVALLPLIRRMQSGSLKGLNACLERAGVEPLTASSRLEAKLGETTFRYRHIAQSRNAPSRFTIAVACAGGGVATLRGERGGDGLAKRIGLSEEVQTGDRAFDQAVYIETAEPQFARRLLADEARRDAVTALLTRGFTRIELDLEEVRAEMLPFRDEAFTADVAITDSVAALAVLARDHPRVAEHHGRARRRSWHTRLTLVYGLQAVLGSAGLAMVIAGWVLYPPVSSWDFVMPGVVFGLALFAVSLWFGLLMLRGGSVAHRHLLISGCVALGTCGLFVAGGLVYVNGKLDVSEPELARVEVLDKWTSRNKNSVNYRVRVASWRPGRVSEVLDVGFGLHHAAEPGRSELEVLWRHGAFQHPWVQAVALAAGNAPDGPSGLARFREP